MSVIHPDQTGQASALTVFTPIVHGEEHTLRGYLEALSPSPLAKLGRTHFGRWVVVDRLAVEPSQRRPDELRSAQLIFSVSFDGPRDSYLDELCATIPDEAQAIWGRCAGSGSARGAELKAYLLANQVGTGLFFAAYSNATVQQVRRAIDLRERVMSFAVRAQAMSPAALRQGFWDELGR